MSSGTFPRSGHGDGSTVVAIAAFVGIVAVIVYGVLQVRHRVLTEQSIPQPTLGLRESASLAMLESKVAEARSTLNVVALAKLEAELSTVIADDPLPRHALHAQLLRAECIAARALEGTVRRRIAQSADEGESSVLVARARAALDEITDQVPGPRLTAAKARVRLAAGEDLIDTQPRVILPNYIDPELRLAALTRAVWWEEGLSVGDALADMIAELRTTSPTALTRGLLALALLRANNAASAETEVRALLETTPDLPLALALQQRLSTQTKATSPLTTATATMVAVAPDPGTRPSVKPNETVRPADPVPPRVPTAVATPVVPPRPPVSEPTTTEPTTTEPTTVASSEAPPAPLPSDPSPVDEGSLAEEGCKRVQGRDAKSGLFMLRRAFDLDPSSAKITVCMAEAHRQLGNDASARALVERILRRSPNHVDANLLAGRLEDARGHTDRARAHYETVLESVPDHPIARRYLDAHPVDAGSSAVDEPP